MNQLGSHTSTYPTLCRMLVRLELGATDKDLEAKMIKEWFRSLDKKTRAEVEAAEEEAMGNEEEQDTDPDAWAKARKGDGIIDEDDDEFRHPRAWKEYKEYLQECLTKPMRGPKEWDITKWSNRDKEAFALDVEDESDDEMRRAFFF